MTTVITKRGLKQIMPFLSKRQCAFIKEWAEIERNKTPTGEDDRPNDIIGNLLLILHWNEIAFMCYSTNKDINNAPFPYKRNGAIFFILPWSTHIAPLGRYEKKQCTKYCPSSFVWEWCMR
jgi:hypothetical protein